MSAQSMSSSGGLAKIIVSRIASTPCAASCWPRSTPLPSDLDIARPWLITWPWFSSRVNGSPKSTMRMSCSTLTKNRLYSRCRIACSTPPTYRSTGVPPAHRGHVERPVRRSAASSSAGSTTRSPRTCPSCRCPGVPGRRTWGTRCSPSRSAAASGETPLGARSWPRRSGSTTGSCSSGTGTSPHESQYTIGMGVPQNRCRESSQSRSR